MTTMVKVQEVKVLMGSKVVKAGVAEAAVAAVVVNLVKTLLTTPAIGVMISPMPMNGTMKSTPAHWQTPRYLRPPEASLILVRNKERRNLSNSSRGSSRPINNLIRVKVAIAKEALT